MKFGIIVALIFGVAGAYALYHYRNIEVQDTIITHASLEDHKPERPAIVETKMMGHPKRGYDTLLVKDSAKFFTKSDLDAAILASLKARMGDGQVQNDALLLRDVKHTIDSIRTIYDKLPAVQYHFERKNLLDMTMQLVATTNKKEDAELARDFFKTVIESEKDPIDKKDPMGSTVFVALRNYYNTEDDEDERKRIANLVLARNRSQEVKSELQRILVTNRPDNFGFGQRP